MTEKRKSRSINPTMDTAGLRRKGKLNVASSCTTKLKVGTHLMCLGRDGEYHPVNIIQCRSIHLRRNSSFTCHYEYYVHYADFNRRLDEWVKLDRLDLNSVGTYVEQETETPVEHLKRPRRRVRDAKALHEYEKIKRVKNIGSIVLGKYEIETWYFSPLAPEFNNSPKLYYCEFCLKLTNQKEQLHRHMNKCVIRHPPGNEIYRNGKLSVFEIDGEHNIEYCLQLCCLAKMFLDDKSLNHDVEYFLFYILCEFDDQGYHIVGYFSKEKYSDKAYNLACILILPPYQRKGYGKFLISFSYELSKIEGKIGAPEKPLSDLGRLSYIGYWTRTLLPILKGHTGEITVRKLSELTSIWPSDVFTTLDSLGLIQEKDGMQFISRDHNVFDFYLDAVGPGGPEIDLSKLKWSPYKV